MRNALPCWLIVVAWEGKLMSTDVKMKILVSSVVFGYEDLLESVYALLREFGYDVLMSHKGTVPVDPDISAMSSCLEAVRDCHLFLGIILPRYGSGREEKNAISITHKETLRAIELNKPRWFLVHEYVAIARQLLNPYRDPQNTSEFRLKPEIEFKKTPILEDLRILDIYEMAMNLDTAEVKNRHGNWVQAYGQDDDARLFATAQFRRYRELAEKYLPRLKDTKAIRQSIMGDQS
ncbi:MAG: DUF4062 domain-containing protein [Candidatus Aegiribacteria sp.]|nr:DUF4062 domain-containing protein [Candidatus Aegiribacteria sp.]